MGVLQEFERRLEGAVEGFFARAFRSGLHPIELAKAAQRYIADNQHVTADGVVVPNVLRFSVGPKDHERLSLYGTSLPRELGEVVARTAAERGWLLRGPVKVRIDRVDGIRLGRYNLQARVEPVDGQRAVPTPRPAAPTPAHTPEHASERIDQTQIITQAPPVTHQLVVRSGPQTGQAVDLVGERLTVGRLPSCDLALDDTTVSREHAALVRRNDSWWVIDLRSTNGTTVNGTRAAEQPVAPGDVIEFGGVPVELVEA